MPLIDLWPTWRAEWILYEDDDVIVVDKPPGMSTHAAEKEHVDDVHTRLLAFRTERGDLKPYLGIHQRLDKDTSGVLLFTKRKEVNPEVAAQFEGRRVVKAYRGVASGTLARAGQRSKDGFVVLRNRLRPAKQGGMDVLPASARQGQEAVTRVKLVQGGRRRALYDLRPETGRTHQIRAQMAAHGAPLVGDTEYGGAPARRLMLHATSLSIELRGKRRTFESVAPAAFAHSVKAGDDELRIELPTQAAQIEAAMREAALLRYGLARQEGTDAFRIANGAFDGLPGVSVDVYGEYLVVSLSSPEAEASREPILDAAARLGARGVYLKVRPKHASRIVDARREEFAPHEAVRGENAPESFVIHELGLPYEVRLGDGLSTGIFLDQRENRRRVRDITKNARVCNLFAYTGPFTVAAVAGGARETVTVDVSPKTLAWARRNLDAIGGSPDVHRLVEADVFAWLKQQGSASKPSARFDLCICDPPSFSTTHRGRFSVESDYKKLAESIYRILAPGGKLLACTNHRGLVRAKFRRYLHEAARAAGREVIQMKDLPDPSDFPPPPSAESHLKSVLVSVA